MTNFLNSVSMEYVVIGLAGVLALALILVIVALVKVSKLKKRYEKFLSGKDGKSLEESIIKKFEKLNEIIVEQDFLEGEIQRIDEEHRSSFSKMEVYKYNAFSDMGGETSFVIALLDHNNNVLTSILHLISLNPRSPTKYYLFLRTHWHERSSCLSYWQSDRDLKEVLLTHRLISYWKVHHCKAAGILLLLQIQKNPALLPVNQELL